MREAARRAGIELILPTIEAPYWREEEYRAAFTRMAEESVDGIVVATMVENWTYRRLIITLAKEFRLPAIYPDRIFVELGGMISFGPDSADLAGIAPGWLPKSSTVQTRPISRSRNQPSTSFVST